MTSSDAHVVVVGAGMAGLAAAAAVARVVEHVTVLDRDLLPEGPVLRRGTPQARHAHVLLAGGHRALGHLIPGFDAALAAAGAREVAAGEGFGLRNADGWFRPVPDLRLRCVTRPVVEATARQLVRQLPNVTLVGGWRVDGLCPDGTGRVAGVHGARDGTPTALSADLVVDATGRGSAAPAWLADLEVAAPDETVVDARLWYATAVGHGTAELPAGMHGVLVTVTPDDPRGAVIVSCEDGTYLVSLGGGPGHDPPRTGDDFRRYAAGLRTPVIARAITPLRLEHDIVPMRATANRRRGYHSMEVPPGLVMLGDSVCALDPVYGQGMTVAAVQACRLEALSRDIGIHHPALASRFQKQAWEVAKGAWDQAVAADLALPATSQAVPLPGRILGRYLRRVMRLCTLDVAVASRTGRVMHLLDPPAALFHPAIVSRVVADVVRPRRVPPQPADHSDTRVAAPFADSGAT